MPQLASAFTRIPEEPNFLLLDYDRVESDWKWPIVALLGGIVLDPTEVQSVVDAVS